jgi:LemA protein
MLAFVTILIIFAAGTILFALLAGIAIYNRLVRLRTTVKSSWSDIDVQLKKRYDLVPNLVETVKGYAAHEKSVLENVSKARSMAMGAENLQDKAKSENMFTDTLKSLFAVTEAYPELKANVNFQQLQSELTDLESNIESARRYYNAVVRDYNISTETFPSNIIADQFRFAKEEFFELDEPESERKPVSVSF